jgi:glycosyltransferase involved in cell wall biosynthesis
MKILHFIAAFTSGGAENMLLEELEFFQGKHEQVLLIYCENYDQEMMNKIPDGVKVVKVRRPLGTVNPYYALACYWMIKKINPDLIVYQSGVGFRGVKSFFDPRTYIGRLKIPTVLRVHNSGEVTRSYYRVSGKRYDRAVCVSESAKNILPSAAQKKASVIYNGVATDKIVRKKTYDMKSVFRIVQVGRLAHLHKGQDVLIKALDTVCRNGDNADICVDFIGEGPSQNYLEQLVDDLNLRDRVHFLGRKDKREINQILHTYDLGVLPSRYEGFGNVLIEYMAAGLPVLASNVDGPAEILAHGKYGWVFESEDIKGCADQISKILAEHGSDEFHKMIERSVSRSNEFTLAQMCENLDLAYKSLV